MNTKKTDDGKRYLWHTTDILICRKHHLFKGRNVVYVFELDGQTYRLPNGEKILILTNLVDIDIKVTKLVKGQEAATARLVAEGGGLMTIDVTSTDHPIFKIAFCNEKTIRLVD